LPTDSPLTAAPACHEAAGRLLGSRRARRARFSFEQLDALALARSDNEAARHRNEVRADLFRSINKALTTGA
jgi:hypothetical protein